MSVPRATADASTLGPAGISLPGQGPASSAWRRCVGTGRLSLALRQDYLDSLDKVQREIGFDYIRGHGLLSDDLGIVQPYSWDGRESVRYRFTYADRVFDSFLERGILPFVELGFMPEALASGSETIFWWRGNVTPPKDMARWADLVHSVVDHWVDRYGIDEVRRWPIEVWNEPNLKDFWSGSQQDYFELYRASVSAIKQVDQAIAVGGPAICGGSDHWMTDFLEFCRESGTPVDFLSRHSYTSAAPHVRAPFLSYQALRESDHLLSDFASGREHADAAGYPELPIHITEFNTSYRPDNPVHDTAHNAAYLAPVLARGGELVDSFSYWTFCDVFEEHGVPPTFLHGGFGLLSHGGLPKPTFHLFAFRARLSGVRVELGEHHETWRADDGVVRVLAWNPGGESVARTVYVNGLASESVLVVTQVVDDSVGNLHSAWVALGRPDSPTAEQMKLLETMAKPALEYARADVVEGMLDLSISLRSNAVQLIEIMPISEAPYPGRDDRRMWG